MIKQRGDLGNRKSPFSKHHSNNSWRQDPVMDAHMRGLAGLALVTLLGPLIGCLQALTSASCFLINLHSQCHRLLGSLTKPKAPPPSIRQLWTPLQHRPTYAPCLATWASLLLRELWHKVPPQDLHAPCRSPSLHCLSPQVAWPMLLLTQTLPGLWIQKLGLPPPPSLAFPLLLLLSL